MEDAGCQHRCQLQLLMMQMPAGYADAQLCKMSDAALISHLFVSDG